jgi:hypothetical protein
MLIIRDDDILGNSSQFKDPPGRFRGYHKWILEGKGKVMHVPGILVTEIQEHPEIIPYIREHTELGEMRPQLHGLKHDFKYDKMPPEEIEDHLERCIKWMEDNLGVRPTIFYTPHGAHPSVALRSVCAKYGIEPVDCTNTITPSKWLDRVKVEGVGPWVYDQEILTHWWEKGTRVARIVQTMIHGSYEDAEKVNWGGVFGRKKK